MAKKTKAAGKKSKWVPFAYPWDDAPIDLSFLYKHEKPAGKHGFLTVKGSQLVFADGTEARFWGTNLNSAANFPPHDASKKLAGRLAKFGVNIARFHQLDGEWSAPNLFQFTKGEKPDNTRNLCPASMDRLDYLIYCLKQEGIYVYLDALTYRRFKPGDNVDACDQLGDAAKPYSNFDPRLMELQKEFLRNLWTHVNPYTKLAYKDDPVIVLTEIANENDFFHSFRITVEPYRSRLEKSYRKWAAENRVPMGNDQVDFSKNTAPVLQFLLQVQKEYYTEMIRYQREIGVRIPITGSNWSCSHTLAHAAALDACDFTDSHEYWGWWGAPMIEKKDNFRTLSLNRFLDRPFVVSEWDEIWPNPTRAMSSLLLAAVASFQDWSGVIIHTYRYRHTGPVDHIGGMIMGGQKYRLLFDTFNDPAKFGMFYHAALLFRRKDVAAADTSVGIQVSEEQICAVSKDLVPALEVLPEKHKTGMVYPGQKPQVDKLLRSDDITISKACKKDITSDHGQLYRSFDRNYGWIDTPYTKIVYGCLGRHREIVLKGLKIKVKNRLATIAVSSLTDQPIEKSDNLLLTAIGNADNSGAQRDAPGNYPVSLTEEQIGHGPIMIESVDAVLELTIAHTGLKVHPVNAEGFYIGEVPAETKDHKLVFTIGEKYPSMYYLLHK